MVKALILAPFETQALEKLQARIDVIYQSWTESRRLLAPDELKEYICKDNIQIVVIEADFIFEEVFEGTNNLSFIGVCRSSVNNVDIDSATQHGIFVVNTPGRNSIAVAELTVGLALSLTRHIPLAHSTVKFGEWIDPVGPYINLRGTELFGKTVGLIGFGAIGQEVAKRFLVFGMTVLAFDPYVEATQIRNLGVQPAELNQLLRESDIISIHCSANRETRGLIDAEQVGFIKPTAYLINTASWEAIDESALLAALENHKLAGAAFDIFATHPLSSQSPLLKMDNIILSPHIGGATDNTITRYSRMITEDIFRFLDGKRPLNLLNPEVLKFNGH